MNDEEASSGGDRLEEVLAAVGLHSNADDELIRSGFVTFVGRPNVGKSTLLNRILGQKVSIVSDKPQTTRHQVRGILDRQGAQIVFVDTPGIHKPRSLMGERLNETATSSLGDIDVACMVVDATAAIGSGDRYVASRMPKNSVLVLNKVDVTKEEHILKQLTKASEFGFAEYFPVSARTGKGVEALVDYLIDRMPTGPRWYPEGTVRDFSDQFWIAELVREQLLAVAREELPHSIATRVTEYEPPLVRVEIAVERESQKGIVIGKGGSVLKEVGTRARKQLPEGTYLELHVTVAKDWQSKAKSLEQFGY
ncbi:MAG: GTPase Era [Microthrixaceae bacterium]|nr:GTPase Era [Microthrixaceae bacterium]